MGRIVRRIVHRQAVYFHHNMTEKSASAAGRRFDLSERRHAHLHMGFWVKCSEASPHVRVFVARVLAFLCRDPLATTATNWFGRNGGSL